MTTSYRSSAGTSQSSSRPPFRRPFQRQAYAAEVEAEEPENEAEEEEMIPAEQEDHQVMSLEDVIQNKAEILATELEEAELQGIDPDVRDDLEAGVEGAAEALVTKKEARTRLAEVKKDRRYGRDSAAAAKPKPKARLTGNQVAARKSTSLLRM